MCVCYMYVYIYICVYVLSIQEDNQAYLRTEARITRLQDLGTFLGGTLSKACC